VYRAVVLTSLVILLSAVVGVSIAQESRLFAGGPNGDGPPGSTTPEQTSAGATGSEGTTASPLPGASSGPEVREDTSEPTVLTEPEPEKPTASSPGDSGRYTGKPEHAGKAPNGKPRVEVGHHGEPEERGRGAGRQKATLCHKGTKTLTVGAPALAAHLRHGDARGACQGEVSGPEPPGETMGPGAAKGARGGGSGGRDKVVCHKDKNTIAVAGGAQAAHLRHDDSPAACE
jgi:hypothetical protein